MASPARSCWIAAALALSLAACAKDSSTQELVKSGDAYMAQKKLPEAILEYKRAVQGDGRSGEARLKLADALMAANDPGMPMASTFAPPI